MISTHDLHGAGILIVDDQASHVQLLERLLREEGYSKVTVTTDSRQVRELHRKNQYDLILLDLEMPGMDGFAVMEGLRADNHDSYLPVVVLTAQPGHKLRALQAGAKDFVSKPFELVEVKTRIHNMLEVRLLYRKVANHNEDLETAVRERTAELVASEARFRRLTELASDWYWEQNDSGEFTQVSGPVQEMLGLRVTAFLATGGDDRLMGWNEAERQALQAKIAAREPFLDFPFSRVNADGTKQQYRVSGEPMFGEDGRFVGFRGIGAEVLARE